MLCSFTRVSITSVFPAIAASSGSHSGGMRSGARTCNVHDCSTPIILRIWVTFLLHDHVVHDFRAPEIRSVVNALSSVFLGTIRTVTN